MCYYICITECIRCHSTFSCNPDLVPSIRVNGVKEPLCRDCIEILNTIRIKNGLDAWIPLNGAYEPVNELDTAFDEDNEIYGSIEDGLELG